MPENYEPTIDNDPYPMKLVVYYDGACPKCIRDRRQYEKLAGRHGKDVYWFDITGQESSLHELGIDPQKALMELHVSDANGRVVSELDAYILLMNLPLIRPFLPNLYHRQVNRRLQKRGLL